MTRDAYRALEVYRTEPPAVELNLADNTNAFGSAPSALAALADPGALAAYPPLATAELRAAIAGWLGVAPDQVVCGCGSNDIIDSAMRAFADPGQRVAFAAPTFVMTPHFAAANSLLPVPVPVGPAFEVDAPGLLAAAAAVTYVATPNNPSGAAADPGAIRALLDGARGVVILDEAYAEFAGVSWVAEAVARGNVLVTRTFSKAWGLAGLRIGYGVGAAPLLVELEKARGPFKVNALAERAARAAVTGDAAWLAGVVARVAESRTRFAAALRARGFAPFPSAANFVGVPVPDARAAAAGLAERGIGVRAFRGLPGVGDLLRITIGPPAAMDRVADALAEAVR
jgi:histidinol-phosphate aminotransferase